MKVIAFIGLY